ncbi:MAG TPA: DUF2510 domain-containing protein [Acidimicrobiales bacterium]|nr:DUF2510 domain-containing protein [Acidimicrobiales bacterium]
MGRYVPSKPGWYRNPDDPGSLRYWDGASWANRSRPQPQWSTRVELFELDYDDIDRSVEGPVHPHELREPVSSGAWSREWLPWRPRHSVAPVQKASGLHPWRLTRLADAPPPAKLGPARRPLLAFVCLVVIAIGVVVSSVAFISPYETNSAVMASDQVAASRFASEANGQCSTVLPKYRSVLAFSTDGPDIAAASAQVSGLAGRLWSLKMAEDIRGPVAQWLGAVRQFVDAEDRYAQFIGPSSGVYTKGPLGRLAPKEQVTAATLRRQVDAAAHQADGFAGALDLTACRLGPGAS